MESGLKQKINERLCHMAKGIQVNSTSYLFWGEVVLPECLRNELEKTRKENK